MHPSSHSVNRAGEFTALLKGYPRARPAVPVMDAQRTEWQAQVLHIVMQEPGGSQGRLPGGGDGQVALWRRGEVSQKRSATSLTTHKAQRSEAVQGASWELRWACLGGVELAVRSLSEAGLCRLFPGNTRSNPLGLPGVHVGLSGSQLGAGLMLPHCPLPGGGSPPCVALWDRPCFLPDPLRGWDGEPGSRGRVGAGPGAALGPTGRGWRQRGAGCLGAGLCSAPGEVPTASTVLPSLSPRCSRSASPQATVVTLVWLQKAARHSQGTGTQGTEIGVRPTPLPLRGTVASVELLRRLGPRM